MKNTVNILLVSISIFSCIRNNGKAEKKDLIGEKNGSKVVINSPTALSYKGEYELESLYKVYHVSSPQGLYDSLVNKLYEENGRIRQMYYIVHDFYGYISNVRWQFYKACGDKEGKSIPENNNTNVELTNTFFLHTAPATYLLSQLLETKRILRMNVNSESQQEEIKKIGPLLGEYRSSYTGEQWQEMYFKDKTPREAIAILNRFEGQIKNMEFAILIEHFKK